MQTYRLVHERFGLEVGDFEFRVPTEAEALETMWEMIQTEKFGIGKRLTLYRVEKSTVMSRTQTELAYAISNDEIIQLVDEEE